MKTTDEKQGNTYRNITLKKSLKHTFLFPY